MGELASGLPAGLTCSQACLGKGLPKQLCAASQLVHGTGLRRGCRLQQEEMPSCAAETIQSFPHRCSSSALGPQMVLPVSSASTRVCRDCSWCKKQFQWKWKEQQPGILVQRNAPGAGIFDCFSRAQSGPLQSCASGFWEGPCSSLAARPAGPTSAFPGNEMMAATQ